jgi:hypothetical protein
VKSIPGAILEIFGEEPILTTEDHTRYDAMIAAFAQAIDPHDFITWCYIKDLTDCKTEIWRYRRMKAEVVDNAHRKVIEKRIGEFRAALANAPTEIRTRLVKKASEEIKNRGLHGDVYTKFVADNEAKIEAEIKATQTSLQKTIDHWVAYLPDENDLAGELHNWIGALGRLDQQISAADERYAIALEDLERHIFGLGKSLRDKLHQIIEGEFVESDVREILVDPAPPKAATPFWSTLGLRRKRSTAGGQEGGGEVNPRRRRIVSGNEK